ncbi:MAG: glycoside hydrolase family 43 protein [Cyclobacteriaceae bacterium]
MTLKSAFYLLLTVFILSCSQQEQIKSSNPVFEGWYADPEGIIFDDEYWIYPTYSDIYSRQVFMDAFSSNDLIEWTKHERIIDTAAVQWADSAMWAPAILKKDSDYFLFFAANDIQNNQSVGGIGIGISDKPEGPYRDYLGRPLLDSIVNGAQPIDQYVFQDTDGQYYMIYGGWRHCNIVRLNDDFTGFEPFNDGTIFKEITPDQYVEGPIMFVRDNKYYFMWSEGSWGGPNYRVSFAKADSPFGPFERIGVVLQQDPNVATGAGHHSLLKNGEDWYIVYHRRPLGDDGRNHRFVCIDKMEFDDQGLIKPVKITFEGVEKNEIAVGN